MFWMDSNLGQLGHKLLQRQGSQLEYYQYLSASFYVSLRLEDIYSCLLHSLHIQTLTDGSLSSAGWKSKQAESVQQSEGCYI